MSGALAFNLKEATDPAWPAMPKLSDLVDSIGLQEFGNQLLTFFDALIGADHCLVFQMQNYELAQITANSMPGAPLLPESYLGTYEIKRRLRQLGPTDTRVEACSSIGANDIPFYLGGKPQAISVMGVRHHSLFYVRIVKTQKTEFSERELMCVREVAELLISLIGRHQDLVLAKPIALSALTSLETIEYRILDAKKLSCREAQVCARILYGFSSCEIASALGVGKESVMTYRKRAYQHLEISSQRELLLWYLTLGQTPAYN